MNRNQPLPPIKPNAQFKPPSASEVCGFLGLNEYVYPLHNPNKPGFYGSPKGLQWSQQRDTKTRSFRTQMDPNTCIHMKVDEIVSRSEPQTLKTAFEILDMLKEGLELEDAVPSNAHDFTKEQLVSFKNEYNRRAKFWDVLSEEDMADPVALSIAALIWASGYERFYDDKEGGGRKEALAKAESEAEAKRKAEAERIAKAEREAEARKRAKARKTKNDKQKTRVLPSEGKENYITQFADKSNRKVSFSPPLSNSNARIKNNGGLRL